MILEGLQRMFILAKAFVFRIIVAPHGRTGPIMALDAEMIVGLQSQEGRTAAGFQNTLRHCDTGGNTVALHFFYRDLIISSHVILTRSALSHSPRGQER